MQSVKNTAVSIILLFLSYGVYQVITKPLPDDQGQFESADLSVVDSAPVFEDSDAVVANLDLPQQQNESANNNDIPPHLLELELPESKSFSPQPTSDPIDVPEPTFDNLELSLPNNNNRNTLELTDSSDFAPAPPVEDYAHENNNQFAVQTTPEIPLSPGINHLPPEQKNEPVTYASTNFNEFQNTAQTNAQFDSDSSIIPSTVMGAVSAKPSGIADMQTVSTQPRTLAQTWPLVEELVEKSNFQDALYELSTFYRVGNFTDHESSQLLDWLDALAAKVIYSTEHHISSMPYIIQNGDTIGALARKWQIPAQLIYNINTGNIPDPTHLVPGTQIKVIQGPFDAEIDSQQGIMTLYLADLYAGRFQVKSSMPMQPADIHITDKSAQDQLDRPFWIALSNGGSIYASDDPPQQAGELGMNLREAEEIFSILSATSKIRILR